MSDKNNIRLGVGLPCTQSHFPAGFVDSFFLMNKPSDFAYIRPMGEGTIDSIRQELVDVAILNKCTHLIMMDTDQIYPTDTIDAMLKHAEAGLDFVAAKVHRRSPPYDPIMLRGEIDNYKSVPDTEWKDGGLVEVDATGFGCVIMNIEAVNNPTTNR